MSAIFTVTSDLDAEFPAVAARQLGWDRVPLLCAREIDVPGSLPRVIRVLLHYYAEDGHEARHVYLGEARRCARTSKRHNRSAMSIEFASRVKRIPVYPAADGYAHPGPLIKLASNEAPFSPHPAVIEAIQTCSAG